MDIYKGTSVMVNGKVGITSHLFNHTSWMAFITPTDHPKSVYNRCVFEHFVGDFVLSLSFFPLLYWIFFCHRTESYTFLFLLYCFSISSFVSILLTHLFPLSCGTESTVPAKRLTQVFERCVVAVLLSIKCRFASNVKHLCIHVRCVAGHGSLLFVSFAVHHFICILRFFQTCFRCLLELVAYFYASGLAQLLSCIVLV